VLGRSISAELQKIANFLLAKALHEGKLPNRESGRPSEESYALTSVERAYRYYELLDAGTKGTAVVAGEQLHVSSRKVELAAQKYRWLIGLFAEDREEFRTRRAKLGEEKYEAAILIDLRMRDGYPPSGGATVLKGSLAKAPELVAEVLQELKQRMSAARIDPPSDVDIGRDGGQG
jgi:hypothetical protein